MRTFTSLLNSRWLLLCVGLLLGPAMTWAQPANDTPCGAIPLAVDVLTPFSNVGATAQAGEPNPGPGETGLDGFPTTSTCNSIDGWCSFELGIQNSVWFTFTPPYEGCFEVLVANDDLQLAIWEVGSCGDFGTYVEVGANDDSADDFWAAGIFAPGAAFELGTTYYIQVDGFAGAQSPENFIIVRPSELCPDPYICEETEITPTLNLFTDNFGGETGFILSTEDGQLIDIQEGYPSASEVNIPLCGDNNCYELTITDSFGDGMCCGFGAGSWNVTDPDGNVIVASPSNGAFGSSETVTFCFDPCDFDETKPVVDCPDDFEVYTDQFICAAYVDIPEPTVIDDCPTTLEARVRKVDPNTLADIPGESWSPWSAYPNGYFDLGTYKVRWRVTDQSGNRRGCTFYFTVKEVLPCPWVQLPDGVGCEDGNSATYADGVFTINSTDCHNAATTTSDEYAFVQQTLCGDGSITAQVTSLTGNAAGWAGVIMRESDGYYGGGTGATSGFVSYSGNDADAKSVALLTNLSNMHRSDVRLETGGNLTMGASPSFNRHWLRIVRFGNNFVGYSSFNGVQWFLKFAIQVDMDECIEIGMVVTSQSSSGDHTATFANVEVTGGGGMMLQEAPVGLNAVQEDAVRDGLNLSTEEAKAPRSFTAYPNPTTGLTTLALSDFTDQAADLEVINTFGQVVLKRSIGVVERSTEQVDLTELPAGVYTIRLLLDDGESEMIQVIKQ